MLALLVSYSISVSKFRGNLRGWAGTRSWTVSGEDSGRNVLKVLLNMTEQLLRRRSAQVLVHAVADHHLGAWLSQQRIQALQLLLNLAHSIRAQRTPGDG